MGGVRRRNDQFYELVVRCPSGIIETFTSLDNLQSIVEVINHQYFNDFDVITRAMVNNWVYKPNDYKRDAFSRFDIKRVCI